MTMLAYVSFAQRRAAGAHIKELEHATSINDLHVLNPTDHNLLLHEGEEVLGAQQNRTFESRSSSARGVSCWASELRRGRALGERPARRVLQPGAAGRLPVPAARQEPLRARERRRQHGAARCWGRSLKIGNTERSADVGLTEAQGSR